MERYARNKQAISSEDQTRLAKASVFVAGCGGLGGYIIELLARLGVGKLTLLDGDTFEVTNLNRQLYALEDNLGQSKAAAAMERIKRVNSLVQAVAIEEMMNSGNAQQLIQGHDLVIDALDSMKSRLELEAACEVKGIPMIHGAIAGFHGQFGLIRPGERLLQRIYASSLDGIEKSQGNPSFTPALIAAYEVSLAIQVLTGKDVSSNSLYFVDLLDFEVEKINFE